MELELCPGSVLAGCHQLRATGLCAGESPYGGTGARPGARLRGDTRQEQLATPSHGWEINPMGEQRHGWAS